MRAVQLLARNYPMTGKKILFLWFVKEEIKNYVLKPPEIGNTGEVFP